MVNNSLFVRGFKTRADKIAEDYRREMGLSIFKPLDAFKLASHLDVPVFSIADVFSGLDKTEEAAKLNETFNAVWLVNEDGDKIILHNETQTVFRQQSNLMHELAHIILGHTVSRETRFVCMLYGLHSYNKQQEEEAKYLGACLQITRPALLWVLKEGWSEKRISEYFNASVEMVRFRIQISGVAKQRTHTVKSSV